MLMIGACMSSKPLLSEASVGFLRLCNYYYLGSFEDFSVIPILIPKIPHEIH